MIIEIRTYTVKPGIRDRFISFIENKSGPVQRHNGIQLLGPFINVDDENSVVYLRGFTTLEERDRSRHSFYGGSEWQHELKSEAMAMIASYKVVIAESTAHAFTFDHYYLPIRRRAGCDQ